MPAKKDIIVIGAGIVGASIAWHLTRAGAEVTIVEAAEPGGVATAASFAWINASWGNPEPYFRLRMRSFAEWKRIAADCPGIQLGWTGGLFWDLPREELEAYATEYGRWGYGIRRVDRAEAARIEPNLVAPPDFALHVAEEGAVEPVAAAHALIDDAVRGGARLMPNARVTALVHENGRIVGIRATDATLRADEVVLAAGVASPELAATAGISLPLETPPGLLVHSHPHARLLNGLVLGDGPHIRQTTEGRIVAGADFGGTDPGADPAGTARALFTDVQAMLKGGDALTLDFHTLGYRPMPSDGFPIIGRAAGVDGLYIAVMHSGITLAPVVGLFATEELLDGRRDPLLAPYGLSRFAQ